MLRLPEATTPAEAKKLKIKLAVIVGVIAIALIWITISIAGSGLFAKRAELPESPEWTIARDCSAKLAEDKRFLDIGVVPNPDDKSRFNVVGAVHAAKDMEPLKARLAELIPAGNYDMQVEVLP